jgi:uncharacterized protein YpuA (DUF1002 family)
MAKERRPKAEIVAMDISHSPDLRRVAEEVERTRKTTSLKMGDEEIAKVVPVRKRTKASRIDPAKLRASLKAAQDMWADSGLDADEVIADIYRAREEGSRPANRP